MTLETMVAIMAPMTIIAVTATSVVMDIMFLMTYCSDGYNFFSSCVDSNDLIAVTVAMAVIAKMAILAIMVVLAIRALGAMHAGLFDN